jgi:NAD(P)H-dependent flavin oxidoreductase YrpB (nitropropane dioxygenase family)
VEDGSVMVGQIAGLVDRRRPVAAIIGDMVGEAETIIKGLSLNVPT